MNSWGRIEGISAYLYYQENFISILNCVNIKFDNKIRKEKERSIFINQYDKNGKIVLPVWETTGRNFDVKQ